MPVAAGAIDKIIESDLVDNPARSAASEPVRAAVTARRRRKWGEEATLAAASLASVGLFLGLSGAIGRKKTASRFDRDIVRAFGRARHPVTNAAARVVTFFGSVAGEALVTIGAVALARKTPRVAAQILTGTVGGLIAELGVKRLFLRERPTLLAHLEKVRSSSFPSGHAMASASLYLTLAFVASRNSAHRGKRLPLLAGGGAIAAAISASRVYLGVHWPTDVLGGFVLGTAWACAAEAAFDLTAAEQLEREVGAVATTQPLDLHAA